MKQKHLLLLTFLLLTYTTINCFAAGTPTVQVSSFTATANSSEKQLTLNWNKGNGTKTFIVAIELGSTHTAPVSGTTLYTASKIFGSGTIMGTNAYVVYADTGRTVTVTNLKDSIYYYFYAYSYNTSGSYNYYLTSPSSSVWAYTLAPAPTTKASNLLVTATGATSFTMTWTPGSGKKELVVLREASSYGSPVDATTYTASSVFGNGSSLSTGGVYVVYNDVHYASNRTLTVTNLKPATQYYAYIYEYNYGTKYYWSPSLTLNYNTYCSIYIFGSCYVSSIGAATTNKAPTLNSFASIGVCNTSTSTVNFSGVTDGGEGNQTLSVIARSNNTALIPTPTVSYKSANTTGSLSFTPVAGQTGNAVISVVVKDGAPTNDSIVKTFTVSVSGPPSTAPATLSGTATVCQGTSSVVYTAGASTGATSYSWALPSGASIQGASNGSSITVNFNSSATSGNIIAYGKNSCGIGYGKILPVVVDKTPSVAKAGPDQTVCAGIATMHANKPLIGTGIWTKASSPGSCSINDVNDSLTNVGTIAFGTPAKLVWTISNGTCAPSRDTVVITNDPSAQVCQIQADFTVNNSIQCSAGNSFTFTDASSGANTYSWNFGSGATPATATTQGPHNVTYSSTGQKSITLYVTGLNGNNTATKPNFINVIASPGAAGVISSNPISSTVCQGQSGVQYSISNVQDASGYSWSLPNGASLTSGKGSNVITVDFDNTAVSGNITVTPVNACGNGTLSTYSVTVDPLPDTTFSIINSGGNYTVCQSEQGISYTISGGNSSQYNWTVPNGASISSGNGTSSIIVNFSDSAVTGNITATPVNSCANYNTTKYKTITVNELPYMAGDIYGPATISTCQGQQSVLYTVSQVNGATGYSWSLPSGASITGGNGKDSVLVQFGLNSSSGNITVQGTNACGRGKTSHPFAVQYNGIPVQEICLATVDSNQHAFNEIVWEKPAKGEIKHFNVYRELITNVDTLIGVVPYDSTAYFADNTVDPNTTNQRYRLSITDTCGNEGAKGAYHRTLFLTVSQGLGTVNLNWNLYEGQTVSEYRVYCDSLGDGNLKKINKTPIPGSNTVWVDNNPSKDPNAKYLIDVIWNVSCDPNARSYSTTRSNLKNSVFGVGIKQLNLNDLIQVNPNPAKDQILVQIPSAVGNSQINIINNIGEVVYSNEFKPVANNNQLIIDISLLPNGIYHVTTISSTGIAVKKLIINQ